MAWANAGEKTKNLSHQRGRSEYFRGKRLRRKVKIAAVASERSQLPGRRDGTLIPQLARQVQFTAKAGNFLNSHLSFKRVPRFSSTVVSSVLFQTYLWDTSEGEIAPFIYGKWMRRFPLHCRGDSKEGERGGKVPKLFYQRPVKKPPAAQNRALGVPGTERRWCRE